MSARKISLAIYGALGAGALLLINVFSLLHVRSQIAKEGKELAALEWKLTQLKDDLRLLEVNVEDSLQPHVLRERVKGYLFVPDEGQVIRLTEWQSPKDTAGKEEA
ncbi:MAG: hypothetical protein MI748_20670 [Opitutales bacterium]|nr:hypothetical protein [Opitutales bacterium]